MTRERQPRAAEEQQQRRRRDDTNFQQTTKLAIPEEVAARLKAEGRTPRWVNDERNRLHQLTVLDDYDKVDGVAPVPVGTDESGEPILAHLLSKPTSFIEEDRQKADARRKEIEGALVKGKVPSAAGAEPQSVQGQLGATVYAKESNSIGRANQIVE